MSQIRRTDHPGQVVQLSLASGGGNPMGFELLRELHTQLNGLGDARALVLDGGTGKLFSGGFNLLEIVDYERAQLAEFFGCFMEAVDRILRLPCPTIAAIHSHALAGGFILSLAFDLRVVQDIPIKLGLNEVDLGIMIPAGTEALLAARTSQQAALRLGMQGKLFSPQEGAAVGYADELSDDAQTRALELATQLAAKPGSGATLTRMRAGARLADEVTSIDVEHREAFLDSWHSPEGQACLKAVADRLRR